MRTTLRAATFVAAVLTLGPVTAHAQTTSANGKIAYVACGPSSIPFTPDQCDIWTMGPDGSNPVNVTDTTDVNEVAPAWSPDGSRIAFIEGWGPQELRIMNADGTSRTAPTMNVEVTGIGGSLTWSPGGTQIAFVGTLPSGQSDVLALDLASGAVTVVSPPGVFNGLPFDVPEMEPAWSPDGGRIAFTTVREETYPDPITGEPQTGAQWEIVTVNPDGTGEIVVSRGAPGTDRANFLEEDRAPGWSPDGSKIVFMSQDQNPSCCGPWQIWAVNRDGSAATNLTSDLAAQDLFPVWSPDGTTILFTRFEAAGSNLYTMPAPTTLPVAAAPAVGRLGAATPNAVAAPTPNAVTGAVTPLTTDGNASDADWQRDPGVAPPSSFLLTVTIERQRSGADGGVVSVPFGILCGRDCSESYTAGSRVWLAAVPKRGSRFVRWAGACSGTSLVCAVTMSDAKVATAIFTRR